MISLEMIGYSSTEPDKLGEPAGDYLALVGNADSEVLVHTIEAASAVWSAGLRVVPMALDPADHSDVARSDHVAFWAHGVPAAMATDTAQFRNPHYHRASDTAETIDAEFAAGAVRALLCGTIAYTSICARDGRPALRI